MECRHERLKCTDNVFYCLSCGAVVPSPFAGDKQEGQKENAPEGPKKAVKRKAKKEDKQHDADIDL